MNLANYLRPLHPVIILFLGLLVAQVIATVQVYLSNLDLFNTLTAVASAGYFPVPNKHVMGSLQEFGPAFGGGLFFTFTIGAGISLGAMATAWIWVEMFWRKRSILIYFGFAWAGLLFLVNSSGFSLMPTLYFLLIAPVVFTLTALREAKPDDQPARIRRLIHLIPIPLLALLWFTQFNHTMFLDLRDNLLLSNSYGRKFSNFYYTYTLYPAEAFKALNQKSIKSSSIRNIHPHSLKQRIRRRLIASDYLPLSDTTAADLVIHQNKDHLVFQTDSRLAFQIPINQFLDDPNSVLQRFSEKSDRHAIFRQFTFLSLLIGFPLSLYMIMHAVFYYLATIFLGRNISALTASVLCLLIGIIALIYFHSNRSPGIQVQNIAASLASDSSQMRVAALKLIEQKKMDLASYQTDAFRERNLPSQERYWLAKALALSRRPETLKILLEFLTDDNLNVRTMAIHSLGRRGNPQLIRPILSKIQNSNNWYEQMYAYKALRSLGWKQIKSH